MLLTYPDIGKVLPCFPSFDADLYRAGNMIGMMTWLFSSMRDIMYSLFQKYNARSATCNKWMLVPIFSTERSNEKSRNIDLKVRAGDTLGNLFEKRFLNFDKLGGLDHIQNLLNLAQKHHLAETHVLRTFKAEGKGRLPPFENMSSAKTLRAP